MKTTINYSELPGKEKQEKACLEVEKYIGNPDVYERIREDIASRERTWKSFRRIEFCMGMFAGIEFSC